MDSVDRARRGEKVFGMALDESVFSTPPLLYQKTNNGRPEIRSVGGFRDLSEELCRTIAPPSTAHGGWIEQDVHNIATLLRELFQNTHDWARRDPSGRTLHRSIRGFRLELQGVEMSALDAMSAEDQPLAEYVEHLLPHRGNRLRLVELTLFDCGPGLAAWRLADQDVQDPTVMDEDEAVTSCLRTHFTSSHDNTRGGGLHHVLGTLTDLNGFLRVRTGRLHLYRDFAQLPYDPVLSADEPFLQDWQSRLGITPSAMASGTFYTVFFPLRYDS